MDTYNCYIVGVKEEYDVDDYRSTMPDCRRIGELTTNEKADLLARLLEGFDNKYPKEIKDRLGVYGFYLESAIKEAKGVEFLDSEVIYFRNGYSSLKALKLNGKEPQYLVDELTDKTIFYKQISPSKQILNLIKRNNAKKEAKKKASEEKKRKKEIEKAKQLLKEENII